MNARRAWPRRPLGELVEVLDARRVPVSAAERASRSGHIPYYGATGQVGTIDRALFDEPLLLLGEDGVQFFDPRKPKAYRIDGPAWVNNHAHVLRTRVERLDRVFLQHFLNHFDYRGYANGTTRLKLTQAAMRLIPVPVPGLLEQRRIVDLLEEYLSSLEAADRSAVSGARRVVALVKSVLMQAIPDVADYPTHWRKSDVGSAGRVELGRQRHPDFHDGPNMHPYLRVANVFEDRIDTSDVMQMDWPAGSFDRFRLSPGEILLNEGQSPHLLGRPAMYRGDPPDAAFTNSLIRFTAHSGVLPEFALLVFRRHMHAGRFKRESRITTNIAHLSASRLKPIEFPIPPVDEQAAIVEEVKERLADIERIRGSIGILRQRSGALRSSLLAAAFSGRLTGRSSDSELVEELADQEAS